MSINLFGKEFEINKITIVISVAVLVILIGLIGVLISQSSGEVIIEKKVGSSGGITQSISNNNVTNVSPSPNGQTAKVSKEEEIKV